MKMLSFDIADFEVEAFDPGGDNERASLRPLRVEELLKRPTPKCIVYGLVPERGFCVLFGPTGSGKTFSALDLACSIARGKRWFGLRVRAGGVIYVAAEGHLKLRLLAYLKYHGLEVSDLAQLRIVPASINLLRLESGDLDSLVGEIKRAARDLGGIVLVVLDTLNSMMPGGNENASEDMGAMISAARRIMTAVDCATLYVHHSGKDESKGSRGHSSLKAAVDCELQVTGDDDRVVEVTKVRDGEPGQQFAFRLQAVDLGLDDDPDADPDERITSCVVEPLSTVPDKLKSKIIRRDVALDALREVLAEFGERIPETSAIPPGVKAVTLDQWKTRWTLRTGYDDAAGESVRVNFDKDRRALLSAGAIQISKPYVWIAGR